MPMRIIFFRHSGAAALLEYISMTIDASDPDHAPMYSKVTRRTTHAQRNLLKSRRKCRCRDLQQKGTVSQKDSFACIQVHQLQGGFENMHMNTLHTVSAHLLECLVDEIQLVEYLLEPQLVCLVDDDEKHFVVDLSIKDASLRYLSVQYLVQLKVFPV